MADNVFGNQEGFMSSFTQSSVKFGTAVATFITGVDAFREVNSEFKDTAIKWGKTFSIASMVHATERMANRYMTARVELSRYFGIIGARRSEMLGQLQSERRELLKYGATITDSLESFKGIVSVTNNLNDISSGLLYSSNLLSKAFNQSADAMGQLTGQMKLFQDSSGDQITRIFGTMAESAAAAGISTAAVMENVRGAAHLMYLYNLRSKEGEESFTRMSLMATGLGMNLGSSVESIQRFRRAGQAVQTSASLNLAGLNISGRELMAGAMSGDPTGLLVRGLTQMQGMGENQRYFAAGALGEAIGMSTNEILASFERAQDFGFDRLIAGNKDTLAEFAKSNMTFTERIDAQLKRIVQIFDPVLSPIANALEFAVGYLEKIDVNILRAAIGIGALVALTKSRNALSGIKGMFGGAAQTSGQMVGASNIPGMGGGRRGSFLSTMNPKAMLSGAASMVVMAGAVWVLGKALHNFADLDWKTLGIAGAAIVGLSGIMVGLGAIVSSGIGALAMAGGAAALGIMGAGVAALGWGMGILADGISPLLGHGQELLMLGPALARIFASMALLPAAGLGGLFGGLLTPAFMKPLNELGEWAETYAEPLNKAGEGIINLSKGIASMKNSDKLSSLAASGAGSGIPLENHITVNIGREKLVDIIADTIAGVK